jgi:hypothetical protein
MTTSKPTIAGRAGYLTTAATLAILIPLYVPLDRLGLQNSLVGPSLVFIMFQYPPQRHFVRGLMSGAIRG